MKLLIGLGNPGKKYENTRHNVGFQILDLLISDLKQESPSWKNNLYSEIAEVSFGAQKTLLVKPQTFMNESGTAVADICNFYKVDSTKDIIVLHDEIDLPFGILRETSSSSAAGHNGIKDIIEKLGTQDFHRLRIGVESRTTRADIPTEAFVLQNFSGDELATLQKEIFPKIKTAVMQFLEIGD